MWMVFQHWTELWWWEAGRTCLHLWARIGVIRQSTRLGWLQSLPLLEKVSSFPTSQYSECPSTWGILNQKPCVSFSGDSEWGLRRKAFRKNLFPIMDSHVCLPWLSSCYLDLAQSRNKGTKLWVDCRMNGLMAFTEECLLLWEVCLQYRNSSIQCCCWYCYTLCPPRGSLVVSILECNTGKAGGWITW